ncbi:MAG: serine/threonine-protein phosphatase, partial [Acidobacteriaceae bacterium]|nr:serine/threonine-protein phosphatase [Acidobacteriaceae bacterium]MBV9764163.1 serine/threonine-protein phosphatase [Acidobacteriaceae bacterium]
MLDLEFAQVSDPGVMREHNEDCLGHVLPQTPQEARAHGWLFALADGVGGQDRGEIASSTAIETLLNGFRTAIRGEPLSSLLPRLVQTANTAVFEKGLGTGPAGCSMATTVVACALRYDRAIVSHAGDSRCYLIRQGYSAPLTRDHTVVNEQLRLGLLSAREAARAETSHLLSRSLGGDMFLTVETSEHQLYPGDLLLLSSDGLHNSVSTDDICQVTAAASDLDKAAHELVALAKQRDGSDNISVQLIRVRDVERVGMYRGRHYKLQ